MFFIPNIAKDNGDMDALYMLVKSNLKLAANIAKRFVTRNISQMDLVQEGNIGLMKAAEKFQRWNLRRGERGMIARPVPSGVGKLRRHVVLKQHCE